MKINKKIAGIAIAALLVVSGSVVGVSAAVNYANVHQASATVNFDKDGNVVDKNGNVIMSGDEFAKNQNGSVSISANNNSAADTAAQESAITIEKDQISGSAELKTDSDGNVVDDNGNILITKDHNSSGSITASAIK